MKFLKEEQSNFFPRKEIFMEVEHFSKSTPAISNVIGEVSKKYKCDKKLIIVKKIDTNYGSAKSYIKVYIYENLDKMKSLENLKEEPKKEESVKKETPKKEEVKKESAKEEKQDGEESKTEE